MRKFSDGKPRLTRQHTGLNEQTANRESYIPLGYDTTMLRHYAYMTEYVLDDMIGEGGTEGIYEQLIPRTIPSSPYKAISQV